MCNFFNTLKRQNSSIVIISVFILTLPLIINFNISDMVLSIRYLSLSILIFLLYLLNFKHGFNIDILKNPIIISLILLFFVNIFSSGNHNLTADALFSLYRLFVLISLTVFFAGLFIKEDYLLIAKSVLMFCLISLLIYFSQLIIAINNEKDIIQSIEGISATMGNKNLLGSILFLSLPFIFYVYQLASKGWKILVFVLLVLILCSLLLIQSKSVLIGLFFMSIVIIIFTFKTHTKLILSYSLIASSITVIFFIISPQMFKHFKSEVDQIISKKERIENNQIIENDSRIALYLKTFEMIKDNPILGVGPGNWRKEIPKYGLKNTIGQKGDRIVQRPHSDFLWFFAEGGVLSGILYIMLFVFMLRETLLFYLNNKDEKRYFFLILFSSIFGFVFISLFDFPSERPSHNLFLSIILGIIIGERQRGFYNMSNKLVGVILLCLFSVNIVYASIRYKGELHMTNVLKYKSIGDWDKMVDELNLAYNSFLFDVDNTTTPLHWYYGIAYFNKGQVNIAFDYFNKAYSVNPYHLHVINNLATCYGFNNNYSKAKELYEKCVYISPRFEDAVLNLASIYSYEQRNEEALDILLGVRNFRIESSTDLSETYIQYFNTIFSKLSESTIYKVEIIRDRNIFYGRLKNIHWMRVEKQMTYQEILKNL